jgi:transcriptional regulator
MFVRPCWQPTSPQDTRSLIEQYPWALLASNGDDGPFATNLPLLIDPASTYPHSPLILVGHLARANDHALQLSNPTTIFLAIFEGPYSYVTASWYPNRDMPSTYYYSAVHCYGHIELQDEPALDTSLEDLTQRMESPIPNGWQTNEIPRSEITRRFAGILGFRLHVHRVEAKFKLGQDEPLHDALAVADQLDARNDPSSRELATLIRHHNLARTLEPNHKSIKS